MEKEHLNATVVFFALSRWNGPYSSTAISLAKEYSKTNRVIYIDAPYTIKDLTTGIYKREIFTILLPLVFGINRCRKVSNFPNIVQVVSPLTMPINFLPQGKLYDLLSRLNEGILYSFLKELYQKLEITNSVFINCYNPFFFSKVSHINSYLRIYYCFDNISRSLYVQKHGPSKEIELLKSYDITLTTSEKLLEYASQYAKKSFCLPNAADFSLFQQNEGDRPSEYPQTPIIGYIGNLDQRINKELLKYISDDHPDKTIILIGPVKDQSIYQYFKKTDNVIFLGKKPLEELPTYTRHFDCALIPFMLNELTACIYPLKLNEYLASGIPVVTTGFSTDVQKFKSVVRIENEAPQFSQAIAQSIDEDSEVKKSERVTVASKNSWANRVSTLNSIIAHHSSST